MKYFGISLLLWVLIYSGSEYGMFPRTDLIPNVSDSRTRQIALTSQWPELSEWRPFISIEEATDYMHFFQVANVAAIKKDLHLAKSIIDQELGNVHGELQYAFLPDNHKTTKMHFQKYEAYEKEYKDARNKIESLNENKIATQRNQLDNIYALVGRWHRAELEKAHCYSDLDIHLINSIVYKCEQQIDSLWAHLCSYPNNLHSIGLQDHTMLY